MYKSKYTLYLASLFAVATISFGSFVPTASADHLISNSDINDQKRVILVETVDVLRQNLKLLQMLYIQKLEGQVTLLQTLAGEQNV